MIASGGAETRSGSMIGSRGIPCDRKAMPFTLISRCSRSVRVASLKIVVSLDTVTGAGNPGASNVIVNVPLETRVRTLAACLTAAA